MPVNLLEYEVAARAVVPKGLFDFIVGGAEDEVSLRENREAFGRWRVGARGMGGGERAGAWWFQIYLMDDRGLTLELVKRAEEAGAAAISLTVDVPVRGRREADE